MKLLHNNSRIIWSTYSLNYLIFFVPIILYVYYVMFEINNIFFKQYSYFRVVLYFDKEVSIYWTKALLFIGILNYRSKILSSNRPATTLNTTYYLMILLPIELCIINYIGSIDNIFTKLFFLIIWNLTYKFSLKNISDLNLLCKNDVHLIVYKSCNIYRLIIYGRIKYKTGLKLCLVRHTFCNAKY